jgi:uncharacterized protein (DUF362 family)
MTTRDGIGRTTANPFVDGNGKALVSKVQNVPDDLKADIRRSVELIGGFEKTISEGDEVWLKPNYNTADPPPGSSDPDFVKAIIELLYEHGASKVIVGESSMLSLPTRKAFNETGMLKKAEEAGAEVVFFDEGKWTEVKTGGKYLKSVSLPSSALDARKLVYVCCMKTHKWAKFSLSLKLAVGFMKPKERLKLHMRHLEEKIIDMNLVLHPNLIFMDGRRCFISGGPACGELRTPNVILASGDRIAMDIEALKIIKSYEGTSITDNPWNYTQIRRAVELGLGTKTEREIKVVNVEGYFAFSKRIT